MRKDIVLAVAVLSVLAGLLTVGHAQNRGDGPDAFELRRTLIDRIDEAYTADDIATLLQMHAVSVHLDGEELAKMQRHREALRRQIRLSQLAPPEHAHGNVEETNSPEGLESVSSAYWWLSPLLGALNYFGCNGAAESRGSDCMDAYAECMFDADECSDPEGHRSKCQSDYDECQALNMDVWEWCQAGAELF